MSILDGMCHRYFDENSAYANDDRRYNRIFVIVLDSLGVGAMPDADAFGDAGADTFGHICETCPDINIPNLVNLGMLSLHPVHGMESVSNPDGVYTRLAETSASKDTMSGHWEMMGIETSTPFATFPDGFPQELVSELEKRCGHKTIGNKVASGTVILDELGQESIAEDALILYTSADSVLQLAANEESFGLDELYRCCEIAREITMKDEWKVGRVIARPFEGKEPGDFVRTANRRDYTVEPPSATALDVLKDNGLDVIGIGKIGDIFSGRGLTENQHSESSVHGMRQAIAAAERDDWSGLCFVNLVDFDSKWGHRRNPEGYAREIELFDEGLENLMAAMHDDDLLILTADHGNDPTYAGTDHTREYVFFIAWSPSMVKPGEITEQETFAVIGASILDNFGIEALPHMIGHSILAKLY